MHALGKKGALLQRYVLFLQSLKCIQRIILLKYINFDSMITGDLLTMHVYVCVYTYTY